MNALGTLDTTQAVRDAVQNDAVRQKLDMDALKKRLANEPSKEEKLRESCEGFEAIFLQKMWEQMRKNVPKEGYLHSKDEETYQSLFDVELCKKMASAGGIGLADMMYEQLSQQLDNTSRTTSPGKYRIPLEMTPTEGLAPKKAAEGEAGAVQNAAMTPADKKLTAENLYSPLMQDDMEFTPAVNNINNANAANAASKGNAILAALDELQKEVGAGRNGQNSRNAAGVQNPANLDGVSWKGQEKVDSKPNPTHLFGRPKKTEKSAEATKVASMPRGMAPADTLWPIPGEKGTVVSTFGWADQPSTGRRVWNSGIQVSAAPGTPVRAVLPGTVIYSGDREGVGHSVVLEHKDGFRSYYGNVVGAGIEVGQEIGHGAEFARIAAQPSASKQGEKNASLHFELKKGEMSLNPESAIPRMTTASR
ncbi:peptidoglycan DD-metalloendopeptidase family protein [Desulfovibrio sp. OttesenSCG-928-G15]|nr:peptidoglycan DD-metalloendopeptidase family protein [Desulfovibrio sp. OttesenSCG-928-G15]